MNIPLSSPDITAEEINHVIEILKTPNLSMGPKVTEFEDKFADVIGIKHAIAVNSGTSALHLLIRAFGIKKGDEIITTPFSFIASSNCILYEQGVPIFVDIEDETFNIDVKKIERAITKKTKAIVAVDIFGHPAEWSELERIAKLHNLYLIEDSCEALGSKYNGSNAGSFGDAGVFGFYPNKQITTGEGGMILTNNDKIMKSCRIMRNQGRDTNNSWLEHKVLGYNYRMSDINCAIGISQLERLDEIVDKRARIARKYNEQLKDITGIQLPIIKENIMMSWFVYVIKLEDNFTQNDRDEILQRLRSKGINCSNYFPPIHLQELYKENFGYKEGDFEITEKVSARTIALPFYNNLKDQHINYITNSLRQIMEEF